LIITTEGFIAVGTVWRYEMFDQWSLSEKINVLIYVITFIYQILQLKTLPEICPL